MHENEYEPHLSTHTDVAEVLHGGDIISVDTAGAPFKHKYVMFILQLKTASLQF